MYTPMKSVYVQNDTGYVDQKEDGKRQQERYNKRPK